MWIILALFFGILAGICTGLIPGLHTNTVAIVMVAGLPILSKYFSVLSIGVFLVGMVITHSFLDFIPSLFFGAPDPETALAVLPGHKMLFKGEAMKALKLTVIGGMGTFLVGLLIIPLLFIFLEEAYINLSRIIAPLLLTLSAIFILKETSWRKRFWAFLIFCLAGSLGVITLNQLSVSQPLFPMLGGIFGISALILALFGESFIAPQKLDFDVPFFKLRNFSNWLKAAISASITSIMPAIGASQAAVIAQGFMKYKDQEDWLVVIGGINTVSAIFTLTVLFLISKARTGVIAAMQEVLFLDFHAYLVLFVACFAAVGIAASLAIGLGRFFAKNISKFNYKKISIMIIIFVSVLVGWFSGPLGLFVMTVGVAIGLLAPLIGIRRIHAMGCLVLPVVFYFI